MNKLPTIAFITPRCDHYNLELFELLARQYEVHFYFTGGGNNYRLKENPALAGNFKVYNLKSYRLFGAFDFVPGLFNLLFREYDAFIKTIDGRFALPVAFFISKIKRIPFIFWTGLWHHPQTFFHKLSFGLTKHMYKACAANLVYGEHIKKYLIDLGVDQKKIFIEHHAVDNEFFAQVYSENEKNRLKKELEILDKKAVLYVGRLEECKGLDYLISAVEQLSGHSIKVVFIGTGSYEAVLKKACQDKHVDALFLGYIENDKLYQYYSIADVFVLPSITTNVFKEPWGFVINEAMNQGCPVIATDAVGAAMGGLVIHQTNGIIVPEKNIQALKDALADILLNDTQRLNMAKQAKEWVKRWNYNQALQDFSQAIEFILKDKNTS